MQLTVRTARRAILRIAMAIGAMVALVSVGDVPVSANDGSELPGAGVCRVDPTATTTQYLLGIACPPGDFEAALGYAPILHRTAVGWRYLKPGAAGGGCSGPIQDTGPFWDFADACRTHDYGYDLVRLGVGSRPNADRLLFLDMTGECRTRSLGAALGCRAIARWARVTLDIGESLRMDPAPVAHTVHGRRPEPVGSGYERVLVLVLVLWVLALQVVRVRIGPKTVRSHRRGRSGIMGTRLGTIAFVMLGVAVAALVVAFFAATVFVPLASCTSGGCLGAPWVVLALLEMAVVLGLPFGGWVGYRLAQMLSCRVGPRFKAFPPTRVREIVANLRAGSSSPSSSMYPSRSAFAIGYEGTRGWASSASSAVSYDPSTGNGTSDRPPVGRMQLHPTTAERPERQHGGDSGPAPEGSSRSRWCESFIGEPGRERPGLLAGPLCP